MTFTPETTGLLLVIALGAIGLLLAAVAVLLVQARRLRRDYLVALDPARQEDVFAALRRHDVSLQGLRADLTTTDDNVTHLRGLLSETTSRVAVVRFDAFDDMGGAMSFAAAMLDEHGTGMVLTSINGRAETRTYVKQVREGTSTHDLSAEEERAIKAALARERDDLVLSGSSVRRRRRRAS